MDSGRSRVRSRRRQQAGLTVAVTGAASGVGHAVAEQLAKHGDVSRVVGVDSRRGDLDGVVWRVGDVTDPSLVERFAGCDAVVHAAIDLGVAADRVAQERLNVRGTQTALTAAAAAGVSRIVVLSSAMAYGALADNAVPLDEDSPLRATSDGSVVGDLLEIEALAERALTAHAGLAVTVVRPAILVGAGLDTVLTRHFESPRLLVLRGSSPHWQFCHVDDAADALVLAALGRVTGAVTVASDGWLDQREVEALSGRGRVELPASMAYGTAERLHRLGLTPAPASELHYVTYPWVVSSARLREVGWRAAYDNVTALQVLLDEIAGHHALVARRIGRRETATLGAAGATVAVLGTAALVRRARKRRRT